LAKKIMNKTSKQEIISEIDKAPSLEKLEELRIKYLGKAGVITSKAKTIGSLPADERKVFGAELNKLKQLVSENLAARRIALEKEELQKRLKTEIVDLTEPVRDEVLGKVHPLSQAIDEIIEIFGTLGFELAFGPDIENDFFNFNALNIPESHPARQMHDTFYIKGSDDGKNPLLLRTHTSSVQIRTMQEGEPPFKFISLGRTYRCDSDATHSPMFHQIEGVYIDKNINMGHLKGCLAQFIRSFFEVDNLKVRLRPSYFPFVEPGAELDIACSKSKGELKVGEGSDWLEILGCGMVHPNVLKNVGIDPNKYQGFAFGMGIERVAMLKYGIPDLRTFYESDYRWLNHYGFSAFDIPSILGGLTR
jgi:phenylalanyl-tRNA synthetase alpha chain